MKHVIRTAYMGCIALVTVVLIGLAGCAPKVGSEAWCKEMDKKAKGDWTADEAGNYAKSCIFKSDSNSGN
ncbi:DUF3012 domain-containing protein [Parendozoicomonas haliclonae]|uniref:DUF3012 domain-containing protein n=1 Tax=Parendozoicomonas haliclonae TaxID=1960125 RepID=A0A1X7AFV5_9GAMM|nr:DUF3012 domain-containing protein [Parendozoicomonas haliclonae]SMA38641.1 hypothetical protein EHSB41UT_00902 [Parendozoicomonas haliclonae]